VQATIVKPEQALPLKAFGLDIRVLLSTEATGAKTGMRLFRGILQFARARQAKDQRELMSRHRV